MVVRPTLTPEELCDSFKLICCVFEILTFQLNID